MDSSDLVLDQSPLFILLCLLVGAGYSALLYYSRKKQPIWSPAVNRSMALVRFLLVSLLCFLLLAPFIKQVNRTTEKPAVVIAVDNSSSLAQGTDSAALNKLIGDIRKVASRLQEQGYQVDYSLIGNSGQQLNEIRFNHPSSDLNGMLKQIQTNYEGRNLTATVLVSDGIYNSGVSPAYQNYSYPVYVLAAGDTVPKQDINLRTLYYNQIAYQGNQFPLLAEVLNTGYAGEKITVTVSQNQRIIQEKVFRPEANRDFTELEFLLDASESGLQHYVVNVKAMDGELTLQNNVSHAYIEVVEGRENVLIVAKAPHPDIKAIKNALERNDNYEVELEIPGLVNISNRGVKYDLVIFHQMPTTRNDLSLVQQQMEDASSVWFILSEKTDLRAFNNLNNLVQIAQRGNETDRVGASPNEQFSLFKLEPEIISKFNEYLPISVPYGNINPLNETNTVFYQKVGNVKTSKPLLLIGNAAEKKIGVLLGSGVWRWRLQEFSAYQNTEAFDEIVSKMVQFLSSREDKRKFKVYPVKNEFENTEPVIFETEAYNEIFEEIYGLNINLTIRDENNKVKQYNFVTSENNTQFRISNLPEGVYGYKAVADLPNGQSGTSEGEFTITNIEIESIDLTARHDEMRTVAQNTGGKFFTVSQTETLIDSLTSRNDKGVIYANEAYMPIINVKWLFFLILLLVSLEWLARKYYGGY